METYYFPPKKNQSAKCFQTDVQAIYIQKEGRSALLSIAWEFVQLSIKHYSNNHTPPASIHKTFNIKSQATVLQEMKKGTLWKLITLIITIWFGFSASHKNAQNREEAP